MKKKFALLTALMMALSFNALAQTKAETEKQPDFRLEGIVLEITQDGDYLLNDESLGEVLVLADVNTIFEGLEKPTAGAYIFVAYSGLITRSLPPQVTAQKIAAYVIRGTVTSLNDDRESILLGSKESGDVIVHLPGLEELPQEGDYVQVYFNGVMALSYPGQISGFKLDILDKVKGTIKYIEDAFFLMKGPDSTIQVNLGTQSRIEGELMIGSEVAVYYSGAMTRSLPPQIFGLVVEIGSAED